MYVYWIFACCIVTKCEILIILGFITSSNSISVMLGSMLRNKMKIGSYFKLAPDVSTSDDPHSSITLWVRVWLYGMESWCILNFNKSLTIKIVLWYSVFVGFCCFFPFKWINLALLKCFWTWRHAYYNCSKVFIGDLDIFIRKKDFMEFKSQNHNLAFLERTVFFNEDS